MNYFIGICGISLFVVLLLILYLRTRKILKRVCVVVLGDIGRSPRMQYHALSFAREGYSVEIVSYSGSVPLKNLQDNPNVELYYLWNPPNLNNKPTKIVSYGVKATWQSINLLCVLFWRCKASYLILQNPPAIPSIPLCWLYCFIAKVELTIDWHNYSYTILGFHSKKEDFITKLVLFIELFFGSKAKYNFCVTKAMKEDLQRKWNIQAKVLYDRPSEQFHPISLKEKHELLLKLSKIYNIFQGTDENCTVFTELNKHGNIVLRNARPGLIISSTSWTEDEDFTILLKALNNYDYQCHIQANFPDLVCVITGKGPLKEFYKSIIHKQNWKHVELLTPWLNNEDYPKLLACADLGVSLHTSSSGLDLPMKIVDMFGCGLPVCAYQFECLHELISHEKNSLIFCNIEELTEQLKIWFYKFPENKEVMQQLTKFKKELKVFQQLRWHQNWKNIVLPCFELYNTSKELL